MSFNKGRKLALTIDNNTERINLWTSKKLQAGLFKKSTSNDSHIRENKEENSNELLSRILDTINKNTLNIFYPDSNSEFKKKIDSLNLKFYLETERYLSNKNHSEKCQTSLFIILFKQINIYIEEIERLNMIIIKKKYDPKKIIERTDEILKKQSEFIIKEKLIKTLKESKSHMESKLLEAIINEDKLQKEIQILKKENASYKKQIANNINNLNNINNILTKRGSSDYSSGILRVSTHQAFHSLTIQNLTNENTDSAVSSKNCSVNNNYYNEGFENGSNNKRNNSDNKYIYSTSSNKLTTQGKFNADNKISGGGKLIFKNLHKSNENSTVNNNFNNSSPSTSLHLKNKKQLQIKINDIIDTNYVKSNLNGYLSYNTEIAQPSGIIDNKCTNIDYSGNKPLKTEYIISDLEDYKKGMICDYVNPLGISTDNKKKDKIKDIKVKYFSKNKEKNNEKEKEGKIIKKKEGDKNNIGCQIVSNVGRNTAKKKSKKKNK